MKPSTRTIPVSDTSAVTARIAYPAGFKTGKHPAVILAHGAGNDMDSPFMSGMHEGLAARGCVAVKFNFPYKERGGRAPDRAPVLEACYTRVVDAIRADTKIAAPRIVIGGKSMGGRMASHLAAVGTEVAGLLLLGYPLHPPRQTEQLRVAHLDQIRVPMLFFAGTRDPLCQLDLLKAALAYLHTRGHRAIRLHVIEGGDHSFDVPKKLQRSRDDVWAEILDTSAAWIASLT